MLKLMNLVKIKGVKTFASIGFILGIISVGLLDLQYGHFIINNFYYDSNLEPFKNVTLINGVYTFTNVCIETLQVPILRNTNREHFNETKRIVVYGQHGKASGVQHVTVAGSINSLWNHWDLHFTNSDIPAHLKYHSDTAFFVQPTCPGNFHHFFEDEFVPLYSVVALSNRLHPRNNNQIVYRTPQNEKNRCSDRTTYEGILYSVYANKIHDVFYNLPHNTCFRHAVFGSKPYLSRQRDVIDHVLRFYGLPLLSNRNSTDLFVTILARDDRRILNMEELVSFVREAGFKNVRIADFEKLSVRDQIQMMSTSNVFIGIHGAGLHWSIFMPEGSFLVELSWPQKHWGFYYQHYVPTFGVVWRGVGVTDVRLNWTSYERNVRNGKAVKEEEKPRLIKVHPIDSADNIWKWADIYVQKKDIWETLEIVYKKLKSVT